MKMQKINCVEVREWDDESKKDKVNVYFEGAKFVYSAPQKDPMGMCEYGAYNNDGNFSSPDQQLEDGHEYKVVAVEREDGTTDVHLEDIAEAEADE